MVSYAKPARLIRRSVVAPESIIGGGRKRLPSALWRRRSRIRSRNGISAAGVEEPLAERRGRFVKSDPPRRGATASCERTDRLKPDYSNQAKAGVG
jgi:hypothetical protein